MPRVEDVTEELIRDSSSGPGEHVRRVAKTKGAKTLSPKLMQFFEEFKRPGDKTIGVISKALAYSRKVNPSPSIHANMIRLIKGGHVRVCVVETPPATDSFAKRESPYSNRFYVLHPEACPREIEAGAATFMGRRGR